MRIIAGTLGGRLFDSPGGNRTHPMSDKIRGALFNVLGELDGTRVLDAFAGSGAIGFEAISRGAYTVVAIDSDAAAQTTIARNITALGLRARVRLIRAPVNSWLQTYDGAKFDIVLLDPPYDNLQESVLQKLAAITTPDGVIVLSWPGDLTVPAFEGFKIIKQRRYGDAQLVYYQR